MSDGKVHIGTSGWHYDHWVGPFYPEDMPLGDALEQYSGTFGTAEINNSFYQLPEVDTLKHWRATVPDHFLFAAKASRYITHMKKLKDPEEGLGNFLDRMEALGDALGPVLFQLPPNWHRDMERLRQFLGALPRGLRCAFEFRDESWFHDEVYTALDEAGAGFCIYDIEGRQSPRQVTGDLVYIRLHGPSERKYEGSYDKQQLAEWAGALAAWARQGRDVFLYFDNDQQGFAPRNARTLQAMLAGTLPLAGNPE